MALEVGSWREVTEVCLDMITSVASTRSPFTSSGKAGVACSAYCARRLRHTAGGAYCMLSVV